MKHNKKSLPAYKAVDLHRLSKSASGTFFVAATVGALSKDKYHSSFSLTLRDKTDVSVDECSSLLYAQYF